MEKDYTITKIGWFTSVIGRIGPDEQYYIQHRALVEFLQAHGLTTRTVLEKDAVLSDDSCLMRSDLTNKGFEVYRKAEKRWLNGIDRGKSPTDMAVFEKELRKLA